MHGAKTAGKRRRKRSRTTLIHLASACAIGILIIFHRLFSNTPCRNRICSFVSDDSTDMICPYSGSQGLDPHEHLACGQAATIPEPPYPPCVRTGGLPWRNIMIRAGLVSTADIPDFFVLLPTAQGGGFVHTLPLEQISDDTIWCNLVSFSTLIALSSSFLRRIVSIAGLSANYLCIKGSTLERDV